MLKLSRLFYMAARRRGKQDDTLIKTYPVLQEGRNLALIESEGWHSDVLDQIKAINDGIYTEWLCRNTQAGTIRPATDRVKLQKALTAFEKLTHQESFYGKKNINAYEPSTIYDLARLASKPLKDYTQYINDLAKDSRTFDDYILNLKSLNPSEFHDILLLTGGYTTLRSIWDKIGYADKHDERNSLDHLRISPRLPSAKKATEDPHGKEKLQPGLHALTPEAIAKNVVLMENYSNFARVKKLPGRPEQKAKIIISELSDNLIWLFKEWQKTHPEIHERSKKWYVGGNRLMHRWANRFGNAPLQVAGITAALSPQKDWFTNVSLTERVLSAVHDHADFKWDKKMSTRVKVWATTKAYLKKQAEAEGEVFEDEDESLPTPQTYLPEFERDRPNLIDLMQEGSLFKQAIWVRAYDEAHNPRKLREASPEGEFGDWSRNDDGTVKGVPWQSFSCIMKSLQIMKAKTPKDISDIIGDNHKVRSFYNNLIAPKSKGGVEGEDVTIDTHAVAAALLRPLAASSKEVSHNFGQSYRPTPAQAKKMEDAGKPFVFEGGPVNSSLSGVTGLYAFYADAYRKAARICGVSTRELQSITWEAIRGLFTPAQKRNDYVQSAVADLWDRYGRGELSMEQVRNTIADPNFSTGVDAKGKPRPTLGGFKKPAWANSSYTGSEVQRDSSYKSEPSEVRAAKPRVAAMQPLFSSRTLRDPIVQELLRLGVPVTRRAYLSLSYPDAPYPYPAELELELPEELRNS